MRLIDADKLLVHLNDCALSASPGSGSLKDRMIASDSKHPLSFVIDEIKPVSRWKEFGYVSKEAAAQDWNNLQAAHYCCNAVKSNKVVNKSVAIRAVMQNISDGKW